MNAIHDVATLKQYIGGDDQFVDRINKLFDLDIFDPGNEPGFTSPFCKYHSRDLMAVGTDPK